MFSLHDTRCLAQDTQDLAYPASEILPRYSRSCRDTRGLVEILEVLSRYSSLVKIDYSSLAQDTRGTRLPVSVIKTLLTKSKTEQTPQNKSKVRRHSLLAARQSTSSMSQHFCYAGLLVANCN